MWLPGVSTGYFGVPGGYGGLVHVTEGGRPICGCRFRREAMFQWCCYGAHLEYVECDRCRAIVIKARQAPPVGSLRSALIRSE